MIICPTCHTENPDDAKYCIECGADLHTANVVASDLHTDKTAEDNPDDAAVTGAHARTSDLHTDKTAEDNPDDAAVTGAHARTNNTAREQTPNVDSPAHMESTAHEDSTKHEDSTAHEDSTEQRDTQQLDTQEDVDDDSVVAEAREIFTADQSKSTRKSAHASGAIPDLRGLERMVDSSNAAPEPDARIGDTLNFVENQNERTYNGSQFGSVAENPLTTTKKRRITPLRIVLIVLIVLIVAAAVAAGVTYSMQLWGGKSIPDVSGLSQVDATEQLKDKGFEVIVEQIKSDDAEGIVLSTDPAAGQRRDEGSIITLYTSIGRYIPDIVGLDQQRAIELLENEGLRTYTFDYEKSNEEEDTVIAVNPEVGERATQDSEIFITLAESYIVPDVIGMDSADAQAALDEAGYLASVTRYDTEDVPEGTVVLTTPEAGSKYDSNSVVTVYVAHNRSTELIGLTQTYFENLPRFRIDETRYELVEVHSVTYIGNNTCTFILDAKPYETHTWMFGLGSETRYGENEIIEGRISYDTNNTILSIEPAITPVEDE